MSHRSTTDERSELHWRSSEVKEVTRYSREAARSTCPGCPESSDILCLICGLYETKR